MIIVDENTVQVAINTLKQIDVRGFDSMDKLVGLVVLFNNVLENAQRVVLKQPDEKGEAENGTD